MGDAVLHMTGYKNFKPGGQQTGQLGVVSNDLFFRGGVFPAGQHRPGRVQWLGGNPAYHAVDVWRIGAHQAAQGRGALQLVALGDE